MRAFILAFGLLAACVAGGSASAHPHAWVDMRVEVEFDAAGKAVALRQSWLFDEFYSAFTTEGFDRNRDGRPDQDKLDALAAENMRNLAEFDYFTQVKAGGRPVALGKPGPAVYSLRGKRLELGFRLPLKAPADPAAGLSYAVFDPTFYVEMLHARDGEPVRLAGAPAGCRTQIIKPSPNADVISLAQSLDRGQTAGDGLGIHFAERVEIRCAP